MRERPGESTCAAASLRAACTGGLAGLSAATPHVVDDHMLVTANSFSATLGSLSFSVGIGIGAALIKTVLATSFHGYALVAALAAAFYLASALIGRSSFTADELGTIAALCVEFDAVAIADEIYEHLVYDGRRHLPIAQFPGMWERTVTICGMGKTFAVTGWRLGYAIAHEELTDALRKVHDFTTVCAPTPLQAAMVAALRMPDSYYTGLVEFYTTRRARMLDILGAHGFASGYDHDRQNQQRERQSRGRDALPETQLVYKQPERQQAVDD